MPRVCQVLRVFTRDGEGGNHLGVINDVIGLDDVGMQAIATDLGFSETVFIEWDEGEIPYVRIFTPAAELPFAGHPLVGTAWTMLTLGPGGIDKLGCGIGPVDVGLEHGAAWVRAPLDPANSSPIEVADFVVRAGLPLPERSWLVNIPSDYLVLEYSDEDIVANVAPEADALKEYHGTMVYARSGDRVRARFFAPEFGVYEDPATGSAAVAWATAMVASGETEGSVTVYQGEEIGFPSQIELSWTPTSARIGGGCVRDELRFLDE
jgi:trans-2,3-dihydro-3-hydroxyanthranilate isomerase